MSVSARLNVSRLQRTSPSLQEGHLKKKKKKRPNRRRRRGKNGAGIRNVWQVEPEWPLRQQQEELELETEPGSSLLFPAFTRTQTARTRWRPRQDCGCLPAGCGAWRRAEAVHLNRWWSSDLLFSHQRSVDPSHGRVGLTSIERPNRAHSAVKNQTSPRSGTAAAAPRLRRICGFFLFNLVCITGDLSRFNPYGSFS